MKKIVLFGHGGSGNHGCEALVRSTIELLRTSERSFALTSYRPDEDIYYGLGKECQISKIGEKTDHVQRNADFFRVYLSMKVKHNYRLMDDLFEAQAVGVKRGDIALSVGGDSYCYGKKLIEELIHQQKVWKEFGLKTVLWGCSIEPELMNDPVLREHFSSFDLITSRETISYDALKKVNSNTVLVADTAFLLEQERLPLPKGFDEADFVGINTSPMIERRETVPGITRKNYERLIESILNDTTYKVLLIPHVIWSSNDDRDVLKDLYDSFKASGRVALVEDHTCCELKGYISRCRFFIGARTHATIAAYSTGVPTLVLGYSTKSKGIAKDLFGSYENYVLPVQNLQKENELVNSWQWLQRNEESIRDRLRVTLPTYLERAYVGGKAIDKL